MNALTYEWTNEWMNACMHDCMYVCKNVCICVYMYSRIKQVYPRNAIGSTAYNIQCIDRWCFHNNLIKLWNCYMHFTIIDHFYQQHVWLFICYKLGGLFIFFNRECCDRCPMSFHYSCWSLNQILWIICVGEMVISHILPHDITCYYSTTICMVY